jgi:hypothetical protein
MFHWLK